MHMQKYIIPDAKYKIPNARKLIGELLSSSSMANCDFPNFFVWARNLSKHQNLFNAVASSKLEDIQHQTFPTSLPNSMSRRDEAVITCAKIGHSHLTLSLLLTGDNLHSVLNASLLLP